MRKRYIDWPFIGICMVVVLIIGMAIASLFLNNKTATQKRAEKNATLFIDNNDINVKRMTCTGDSDGDGYGTCTLVTDDSEKIQLQCNSGWVDVVMWGATGCKEVSLIQFSE